MRLFVAVWKASRWMPRSVIRAICGSVALIAWVMKPKPVTTLEHNLSRVTGKRGRALRRLSRAALRSTARYYAETLELPRVTGTMIDARVRAEGLDAPQAAIRDHGRFVVALSHSGNWDLTGAYSNRRIAPVTAVAEILKPAEMFAQFVSVRAQHGITVIGHEGSATFKAMIARAKSHGGVLALVADRDLSGSGIEVDMWGHGVRVAPGPAALALATHTPLFSLMVRYERLRGKQRRQARSKWGIVLSFSPEIEVPDGDNSTKVALMTQGWATWMADGIARSPQDWHMLQRMRWSE